MDPRIRIHTNMSWIRNTGRKDAYRETSFTAGSARHAVYLGSDCSGSCNSFAAEREPEAPAGHQVGPGFHNSYLASALQIRMFIPDPGHRLFHPGSGFSSPDILNPNFFPKFSEMWSGMFLSDLVSRIPDSFHHWSRYRFQKTPDPGSATQLRLKSARLLVLIGDYLHYLTLFIFTPSVPYLSEGWAPELQHAIFKVLLWYSQCSGYAGQLQIRWRTRFRKANELMIGTDPDLS
jgi:hypothetical protein